MITTTKGRLRVFLLLFALIPFLSKAQEKTQSDLSRWQQEHPAYFFVNESRLAELTASELELIGDKLIIFSDKSTQADIEAQAQPYSKSRSPQVTTGTESQGDFIKSWLGAHPGVAIYTHSEYEIAGADKKAAIDASHALVLAGEVITVKDILNYPY